MQDKSGGLQQLVEVYFSSSEQWLTLKKGETLMSQGDVNECLFLVKEGLLGAHVQIDGKASHQLFTARPDSFVGVYSFFSKTYRSSTTIICEKDARLAYIDRNVPLQKIEGGASLFEQFMPVIMTDLNDRWQREQLAFLEKEKTVKKLMQTEKLASLGQMAAGIAHELNNAIAVLERTSAWMLKKISPILEQWHAATHCYFKMGADEGRKFSSWMTRQYSRELETTIAVSDVLARQLAQTGLPIDELKKLQQEGVALEDVANIWELGAAFHAMEIASEHATHVVKSIKNLAATEPRRETDFDVNEAIHEALTILSSPLRKVEVHLELMALPGITANKGDLVQVWMNLLKNAVEAILKSDSENPIITIRSKVYKKKIHVEIEDNGPGIPRFYLKRIFQPDFTTKGQGLEFGLGLGLSIVERIVDSYEGTVNVKSKPGNTVFTVILGIS